MSHRCMPSLRLLCALLLVGLLTSSGEAAKPHRRRARKAAVPARVATQLALLSESGLLLPLRLPSALQPAAEVTLDAKREGAVRGAAPVALVLAEPDAAAAVELLRRRRGELMTCYEAALRRDPALSGKLTLSLTVGLLGEVRVAEVQTDTLHDERMGQCIVDRAAAWRFPMPPEGSSETYLTYPLIFQSGQSG